MTRLSWINPAVFSVLVAATLWGMLGVAYEIIDRNIDVDRFTVVTLRAVGATVVLIVWWSVRDRTVFAIDKRDCPRFVMMGLVSVTLFYVILIYAFAYTSVAVGTLLLYLAPAFVTIAASLFLGEPITQIKILALTLSFAGCALVVEITNPDYLSGNLWGIVLGLASAVCYGSYSLLAKPMLARYRGATVQAVHMIIGSAALLIIKMIVSPGEWPSVGESLLIALACGIALSVVPVALYTAGLNGLPSSDASILATWEPVVAVLLAAVVLGERLGSVQTIGACFVVGAVVLLGWGGSGRRRSEMTVSP